MKMTKMMFKNITRCALFLIVILGLINRIAASAGSLNLHQDHHRSTSSNRDIWPSWLQRRQESSSSDRYSSNDNSKRDGDHYLPRHETVSHSRSSHTNLRTLHNSLLRNSRSHNNDGALMLNTSRNSEKNFYDLRGHDSSANEATLKKTSEKISWGIRNSRNKVTDLAESKTLRPTTTMVTATIKTTTRTNRDSSPEGKPEKLTAVAVAEYTGTRAVAYAGYHHHNHDYNPTRTRDVLTPGYAVMVTQATPTYTKHHPGRRVCSRQTPTSMTHHHRSRQYRLFYTELSSSTFVCCPGWSQVSRTSYGCNRPTCPAPCLNGGICGPHGKCNCPKAFTGTQCQTDVDECVTEKPCGQLCTNLPGSYECHCRYGFHLLPDRQSCRKNGSDGTAFEARDLENDYGYTTSTTPQTTRRTTPVSHDTENEVGEGNLDRDYDIILKRLTKLEKQIARGRKRDTEATEMGTKITQAVESVATMRRAVDNVQLMQQEIYDMRGKVKQFELESRKLQHLTNRVADLETRLRLRCRNSVNGWTNLS